MKTLNINSKVRVISPVLDLKQHAQMRACLELSASEISFALFSSAGEIVLIEQVAVKPGEKEADVLSHLANQHEFFFQNYASVQVSVASSHFTLVPRALYDPSRKDELLKFNHPLSANEVVQADELFSIESYCVYGIGSRVKELIDKSFPNNHIRHKASVLIETLPKVISKNRKTCLVNVQQEQMDIAVYDKKLLFFNSFSYQASEDFLYFILAALEQNNCALDETDVVLAGEIETGSALHNTLRKYIPSMRFAVADKTILKKGEFAKLPEHAFYSLFNLYLCAL